MKLSKFAAAVALLVSAAGGAQAATVSNDYTFSSVSLNWSQLVNVTKFDTSLGTLNSITFSFEAQFPNSTVSVTNTGAGAGSWRGRAENSFALYVGNLTSGSTAVDDMIDTGGAGALTNSVGDTASGSLTSPTQLNLGSFTAGQNKTGTLTGYSGLQSIFTFGMASPSDDLSLFIGSGTTALTMGGLAGTTATSSGSFDITYNPLASGTLTVVYDYTAAPPVPEPESYAMLLAGLAAIGVVARRRRVQG